MRCAGYGVYSNYDHNSISFDHCTFYQLYDGINVGGGAGSRAVNTKVESCYFDLIDRYGFWVQEGYGNVSSNNKYMNVGNDNNGYANATYSIIRFDDNNNQSIGDYFDRNSKLKDQNLYGVIPFKPNVQTPGMIHDFTNFRKTLNESLLALEFFRIPLYQSATYVVDYVIEKTTLGTAVRTGKLHITANLTANDYHINDEFSYTGSATVENVTFSASLEDFDGDTVSDTLVIKVLNSVGNGTGTVNYSYRTLAK